MNLEEFSEISIENIMNMNGEIPFAVHIRLSDSKFTQIFKKGDRVDLERVKHYSDKGVKQFYIHKSERNKYIVATEILVTKQQQNEETFKPEHIKAVEELTEQTLLEIHEDKIFDEDSLRRSQTIVKSYIDIVKKDPKALATFVILSKNESYECRHAIATAVFAILLAKADKNDNDKTLSIIGLGALLHDIGMSMLPESYGDVNRSLTREEWQEVKMHPAYGIQMIATMKSFPDEVKLVVEQHHEHWDGSGYPKGLRGPEIFYPSRVVAVADAFSALTTRRGGRSLYKPEDALSLLLTEQGKYDPQLIKAFRSLFNVQTKKTA